MQNSPQKNSPNFKVARIVDSENLAQIHQACFGKSWSKDDIISYLRRPACYALWFEDAAFILFEIIEDQAEIKTLAVLENSRRQNLATILCNEVIEVSREFMAKKIFLEVSEKNEAAIALYKKLNFQQYNRRKDYYTQGEDALLLSYEL